MSVLPARLHGSQPVGVADRLVLVTDPKGAVRVRWTPAKKLLWRCDHCGAQERVECAHTFAAGLVLAEHLLGLTRTPELEPTTTPIGETA